MTTARTARPIGSFIVATTRGETLDRYSSSMPGPLGYPCRDGWERPESAGPAGSSQVFHAWLSFDLDTLPTDESLPARARGSIRIVPGSESDDAGYKRVRVRARDRANEIAARLIEDSAARSLLRQASMRAGESQISWVAEQLLSGRLIILWRLREPPARPPAAEPARPPAPTPRAIPTTGSSAAPDSTFPPDLDAAAVAQSLKSAAEDGMPFCEECMKEQARRDAATGAA